MEWNNGTTTTKYAYVYNLQGDVIALINSAGTKVVGYTYDAWGKPIRKTGTLADTLGALNPFRYRGYVYDDETGLYYLRSRYYNAKLTRFVSIDIVVSKIGDYFSTNSYTYVKNDPIDRADANGTDSYYVIFDSRENGKGLSLQGKWAINLLESMGHSVERKGYTDIPGFITAWNYAGNKNFDYIVIYAHGSPGTIDCNHGYLKETMFEGKIGDNYCFSSISRLDEIQVQKRIFLFSCHGATPNNDYKTAIGMLSSKAGYVATEGSAYASVNYVQGTGIPEQGPGWNWTGKSLIRNILDLSYWLFSSCWVTFSDSGLEISDRPSFP